MTKIRLNNAHRDVLREYGAQKIASLIDRSGEHALYAKLLDGANEAIRAKYPEEHMGILRLYRLNRADRCLRFQFPSTRVDGFTFHSEDMDKLADVPCHGGCYNSDVFVVNAAFEQAYDDFAKVKKTNDEECYAKQSAFNALVLAAQTLDDVLAVIELPADVQERLGRKSTALVALSADTLKSLKKDFAIKKAA